MQASTRMCSTSATLAFLIQVLGAPTTEVLHIAQLLALELALSRCQISITNNLAWFPRRVVISVQQLVLDIPMFKLQTTHSQAFKLDSVARTYLKWHRLPSISITRLTTIRWASHNWTKIR